MADPVSLGAYRLAEAAVAPVDVVARRQLGRYYDLQGTPRRGLVDELESRWAEWVCRRHTLAQSSATSALALALRLVAGQRAPGSAVVVPAYAFAACAVAIAAAGFRPLTVGCGSRLVPEVDQLAQAATGCAAVLAVHMRGIPVDVRALRERLPAGTPIVEDCSQFDGMGAGAAPETGASTVSVYSFQSKKLISAGEGGMLACDDTDLFHAAVQASDSGWFLRPRYRDLRPPEMILAGSRMNEVTAGLLLPQLEGIAEFCSLLVALRRRAEEALGDMAHPVDSPGMPDLPAGGTVAVGPLSFFHPEFLQDVS
jgi:dTDP-4-amino-4,6-dideoxygalactose transaminase